MGWRNQEKTKLTKQKTKQNQTKLLKVIAPLASSQLGIVDIVMFLCFEYFILPFFQISYMLQSSHLLFFLYKLNRLGTSVFHC